MDEKPNLDGDERGIGLALIALFAVVLLASTALIGWSLDDMCRRMSDELGQPISGEVQSGADAPSPDPLADSSVAGEWEETSEGSHVKLEWLIGVALLLFISMACTCLIIAIPLRSGKRVPIGSVVAGIVLCCMLWLGLSNLLNAVDLFRGPDSASSSTEERFQ